MCSEIHPLKIGTDPEKARKSRRLSILEGMVSSAHGACVGGAILTAYALGLGTSDFHLGLFAGFSTIAHLGLIAGARVSLWLRTRKRVVIPAGFAGRALWGVLAVVPFLPVAPGVRIWTFLAVVMAAHYLLQAAASPWNDWIADLVPETMRGRYFGLRNAACGAVGMLSALAAGRGFDRLKARAPPGEEMGVFIPFFLLAAALAAASAGLFGRMYDPPISADRPRLRRDWLLRPLRHAPFRALIRFQTCFAFACSLAGPFYAAHMLRNLRMTMSAIAGYGVIAGSVGLLSHPLWGRIADRYGNRPVLVFNLGAVVALPLIWFFATPTFLAPLWVDAALTGICWPGLNLSLFNLMLGTAPAEERQGFLATHGVLIGAAHFAAATAGGFLAESWSGFSFPVGPIRIVNFHLLFGLSALGRLVLIPLAIRLHEPRAVPVRVLISGVVDARCRLGGMILSGMEQSVSVIRRLDRKSKRK